MKLWRSIEKKVDEHFIAKVFLYNINLNVGEKGIDHVNGLFMNMIHILIEKEAFLLR